MAIATANRASWCSQIARQYQFIPSAEEEEGDTPATELSGGYEVANDEIFEVTDEAYQRGP